MDLYCNPVYMACIGAYIGGITGYITATMAIDSLSEFLVDWGFMIMMDNAMNGVSNGIIVGLTVGNIMNHK